MFVTGGTMPNAVQAPAEENTVKSAGRPEYDGAQHHGRTEPPHQSRRRIVVPPGVAHWFSAIEQDLDYFVFRVDPDHVLPAGYVHPLLQKT